jgi:hypothetical protein
LQHILLFYIPLNIRQHILHPTQHSAAYFTVYIPLNIRQNTGILLFYIPLNIWQHILTVLHHDPAQRSAAYFNIIFSCYLLDSDWLRKLG